MSNAYVSMGWNEGRGSHSHYHLILMIRRPSDLVMISLVTSKWQDFKVEMPALLIYCISSFSFRSWIVPHIYVLWPLDFQIQKRIFPQKLSRIGGRKRNPKGVDETHKWHQRTFTYGIHFYLPLSLIRNLLFCLNCIFLYSWNLVYTNWTLSLGTICLRRQHYLGGG